MVQGGKPSQGFGIAGAAHDPEHAELPQWRAVHATNLDGVFLGTRYGIEAMNEPGFVMHYIRGVLAYRRSSRDESESDHWREEAIAHLIAALDEPDAADHPLAVAACMNLLGWALHAQQRYADARLQFMQAAARYPNGSAEHADALWMAIVCVEQLVLQSDESDEFIRERDRLIKTGGMKRVIGISIRTGAR